MDRSSEDILAACWWYISLPLPFSLPLFLSPYLPIQPGTIEMAVNDIRTVALPSEDGEVLSVWLLAEWVRVQLLILIASHLAWLDILFVLVAHDKAFVEINGCWRTLASLNFMVTTQHTEWGYDLCCYCRAVVQ